MGEGRGVAADRLVALLRERIGGEVRADEPLAGYTTLRVGGPAAALVHVDSVGALAALGEVCAETATPWAVLGRGSNVLVADAGWPGVVVLLGRGFRGVEVAGEQVVAGAGEPMPGLAVDLARRGLSGLTFGIAIPGTLGGAVRMNAGAHGSALADVLDWVELARLDSGGAVERWRRDELGLGYRTSSLPDGAVVLRAGLGLRRAEPGELASELAELRRWRRAHQPVGTPSCGSVFRNPVGDAAGRLVEAVGLKGRRVGGAQISPRHANFITTERGATAADVHALITEARRAVAERCGVTLATEVVLLGFAAGEQR